MTALYLLTLILATSLQPTQEEVLDLTAPVPPDVENRADCKSDTYSIARLIGRTSPKMPLKITLVIEQENQAHRLGDEVTHKVLVENVGREPYIIPWAGLNDLQKVRPEPCGAPPGFKWFILSLTAQRAGAGPDVVWALPVIGSELLPGSLKELKPGERVWIRAKGSLAFYSSEESRQWLSGAQFPVTTNLKARLTPFLGFTPATIPDPVISENTITISISK